MTITSITIGAVEYISKIDQENFTISDETGGRIGTLSFLLFDTHANIAALAMGGEVIAYVGATKRFGGYLTRIEPLLINETTAAAQCLCQDYNSLLETVTVPLETYAAQTDEAILDDLFSTYLPEVSTAAVVQVKASVTVTFSYKSLRQCVETLMNLTGAEWYVDANKALQWYDPAAVTPNIIELKESPDAPVAHGPSDLDGWYKFHTTYSAATAKLAEDTWNGQHFIRQTRTDLSIGDYYVFSADVAAAERTWINMWTDASGAAESVMFDIVNGAIGGSVGSLDAKIEELGGGVFRCHVGVTVGSATTKFDIMTAVVGSSSFQGVEGYGVYVYAARLATGVPFLLAAFTYSRDFQNRANSVTVVGATTDEGGQFTYSVNADSDDGYVWYSDTSWYPDGGTSGVDTSGNWQARAQYVDPTYYLRCGLVTFDTSGIPDDATVTAAELRLCLDASIVHADGASWGIEWYTVGTIDSGDYTSTFADDAFAEALLAVWASVAPGYMFGVPLLSPANVNKTGKTGFRFHIKQVSAPTGDNAIHIVGGATDANRPQLRVTYTYTPTIRETRTDATSIGLYGTFKRTIYDESILTAAQAILRADVELLRYAYPQQYGIIAWEPDGIKRGDVVRIVSGIHGIDGDFHISSLTMQWRDGLLTYVGQFGQHQPDLIRYVRLLAELQAG